MPEAVNVPDLMHHSGDLVFLLRHIPQYSFWWIDPNGGIDDSSGRVAGPFVGIENITV